MPAHVPARARLVRRQEGLRRGRLRRLHGLARRHAGPQLPGPRLPGRRPRGHDDRGARAGRRAAPDAAGVPRRPGVPVRLLHGRHDHDGGQPRRRGAGRSAARAQGQPLPVHRLPRDRGRHPRRRVRRGRRRRPAPAARACTIRSDRRSSRAAPATRSTSPWTACSTSRSCARRTRTPASSGSAATRRCAVPGVVAVFTWEDVPRRLYSTATHEDHLVDPDDTYILDNVVRFVGQRVAAVVAETEGAAEAGVPPARGRVRDAARRLRPGGGHGAGGAGPPRQGRRGRRQHLRRHPRRGRQRRGRLPRGRRRPRDDLRDVPRPARAPGDPRLRRLEGRGRPASRPHQLAGALHHQAEALLPLRALPAQRARLHRARRRRLRRQAGDALRGPVRPRHAQDGPAGDVGVHAGGAVHRRDARATR